jgi:hypothetical protein
MHTKRWKLWTLLVIAIPGLWACDDIIVSSIDRTAPELALMHFSPTPVRFADTLEEVTYDNPIRSGRPFIVEPRSAREDTNLIPIARDRESAIRLMNTTIEVTFACDARVLGGNVYREARASFAASELTPDEAGTETKDTESLTLTFNMNDLWKRGNCERWGQVIDVRNGSISGIRGVVRSSAMNNALPGVTSSFEAPFTVPRRYTISY